MRPDEVTVFEIVPMIAPEPRADWIIRQARQRPGAERAAFLDGACAGDLTLRERLESLLAAREQPETLPAAPAEAARPTMKVAFADEPADEAVGRASGATRCWRKSAKAVVAWSMSPSKLNPSVAASP